MFTGKYGTLSFVVAFVLAALLDIAVVEWIADRRSEWLVMSFRTITDLGDGTEYFCLAAFLLFLGLVNRGRSESPLPLDSDFLRDYGWLCLKVMVITGVTIVFFKVGFGRSRPDLWIEQGVSAFLPLNFEDSYDFRSFPSGHTQTAFTVAVLASLLFPRKFHPALYALAGLVGVSRVVLLAHWPSDVVVGAFIGVLLPVLIIRNSGVTKAVSS